uniref:Retrotransposon gag protein n=1 Tax=Solanum tuberosum TaxID=4113 RepID=M0ZUA6_SOLTU
MIKKVGHQALSLRGVFQAPEPTQLVQSVGQEGNNSRAQSTTSAAPTGCPTQQGNSCTNRLYALQARQDQEDSPDVVSGTLQVFDLDVYALLDPGATLSFVTPYIAVKFDVSPETLSESFSISTLVGDPVIARLVYRNCPVTGQEGNNSRAQSTTSAAPTGCPTQQGNSCTNRLYALQARQDQEDSPDVVSGTLQVFDLDVYALLDPGATLSFVTPYIAVKFDVSPETLSESFSISTLVGDPVIARLVYRNCPVTRICKLLELSSVKNQLPGFSSRGCSSLPLFQLVNLHSRTNGPEVVSSHITHRSALDLQFSSISGKSSFFED